jgi:O-antigen/teichoic acid export membrane protein
MNALRSAAAGIVAAAAVFLAGASLLAFIAGGYVFGACVYAACGVGLFAGSRRLRPRRRFVFARR